MSDQRIDYAADQSPSHSSSLADDLLRGADDIALFVFGDVKHRRKIYNLVADTRRRMPHFKLGSIICARRSVLLRWIAAQENRE